jgi:hypothetical protein
MATTTTPDEYIHPIDVRKSHVLTKILERKLPETNVYDVSFMPIHPFSGRKVKLQVRIGRGSGLAPFKADNASTPILEFEGDLQELYMELVTIAEEVVLNASDLLALDSPDESVARLASRDILDKGSTLRLRNVNRTRWMAWQASQGTLPIVYPNGTVITIDWDFAGKKQNNFFSATHLQTAAVNWNHQDENEVYDADIITDVYNWTKIIGDDLGCSPNEVTLHMNSTTWRYIRRNKYLLKESNPAYPVPRTAPLKLEEVVSILDVKAIKIMNPFYLTEDTTQTKTPLLEDHKILFTGPYTWQGEPISEMYDGPVVRVEGERIVVERNPGMKAEIYIDKHRIAEFLRVQTARMPIINFPAAFLWATVVSG